jgi:hypothetical protein
MDRSREYKPNYLLIGLAAIGAVLLVVRIIMFIFNNVQFFDERVMPMEISYVIVRVLSALFVYMDAKKIEAGKAFPHQKTLKSITWTPGSWAALVFVLWILYFPKYLSRRSEIFWQNISVEYKTLKAIEREIKPQKEVQPEPEDSQYSENVRFCPRCNTPYPITMLRHSKHCIICGELLEQE